MEIKNEYSDFDFNDYPRLEKRLMNGQKTIYKPYALAGGPGEENAFIFTRYQILELSLSDYMSQRDDEKTQELLHNLDKSSLTELREKYFPSEYRGECVDDLKNLSPEEMKRKYYLNEESDE